MSVMLRRAYLFSLLALAGCAASDEGLDEYTDLRSATPPLGDTADGKNDTGYVGDRATEVDATARAMVTVPMSGNLASIAASLRNGGSNATVSQAITDQIKFARIQMKRAGLSLNLEHGAPTITDAQVNDDGNALLVTYEQLVEAVVRRGSGTLPEVGSSIRARVPNDPAAAYGISVGGRLARETCTTDISTGSPPSSVSEYNFFYYFDPDRDGCVVRNGEQLTELGYEVTRVLGTSDTVYPEFDRLVSDGRLEIAAIYGQMGDEAELSEYDAGFRFVGNLLDKLRNEGFTKARDFTGQLGERWEKTYSSGLTVGVDIWNPRAIARSVPRDTADQIFKDALASHEVFLYGGHAGYGSLHVLDDPNAYPSASTYQIVFMDACFSYAYYTKQVIDIRGAANVDVVNNTEYGVSDMPSLSLIENLLHGAAAVHGQTDATQYSWQNLVTYMNQVADNTGTGEIFGVSGVVGNRFAPGSALPTTPTNPNPPTTVGSSSGYYGTLSVSPGFTPDPQIITGYAGGTRPASQIDSSCLGTIAEQPDLVLDVQDDISSLRILGFGEPTSGVEPDLTLVVQSESDPSDVRCGDDESGRHPIVEGEFAAGRYKIWIGTYGTTSWVPFRLGLTERSDLTPSQLASGTSSGTTGGTEMPMTTPMTTPQPMITSEGTRPIVMDGAWNEVIRARPGEVYTPVILSGLAGGTTAASSISHDEGCHGFVDAAPDFHLQAEGRFEYVRVLVDGGDEDLTMMIQFPDGRFVCSDDAEGRHPIIEGRVNRGQYNVWVGRQTSGGSAPFRLAVTEQRAYRVSYLPPR